MTALRYSRSVGTDRERPADSDPYQEKPVGIEETRAKLEFDRIEAETVKLRTETARMALCNMLDKVRLVLTPIAAAAAVLVALDTIGLIGAA